MPCVVAKWSQKPCTDIIYTVGGLKIVVWREEFEAANCSEPVALAMAIQCDTESAFN